ncbi:hypothetical protein [Halocatena marina]|nr:hypothetical protein [Halocatena marina]
MHNGATVTEITEGLSIWNETEYRIGLHVHQHDRYANHQFVICDAAK